MYVHVGLCGCQRGVGRSVGEGQSGRGVDLFFKFTFMNTKRRAVSSTLPKPKKQPDLPLPVLVGQTQYDIPQSRKTNRGRYMETSERKTSPGNVWLHITTSLGFGVPMN